MIRILPMAAIVWLMGQALAATVVEAAPEVARRLRVEHLLTMTAGLSSTSFGSYGAYGCLWWLPEGEPKLWLAAGYGSQLLVVAPESRVVVAVTSTLESKGAAWDRRVLDEVRELGRSAVSTGGS